MPYLTTNYQIASGHNAAGSLTAVTSLTDGNATFTEPWGLAGINRGQRITLANGTVARIGDPRAVWISDMLYTQWEYLRSNYQGLVTVKLSLDGANFANYNAVLTLPDPDEMQYIVWAGGHVAGFLGPGFRGVRWTFTRLQAL